MKLIGFEGHEILAMNYQVVEEKEIQNLMKAYKVNLEEIGDSNVFINEDVEIKITHTLDKCIVRGTVLVVDLKKYRNISFVIIGEFNIDNEGEKDPKVLSDKAFEQLWPMLKKYISPTISTITSITALGELKLDK